jgi:hypothetical protein
MPAMQYATDGESLIIKVPLDALVRNAMIHGGAVARVVNADALALAVGRELIDCEDISEQYYLSSVLDAAVERVIESADPSLEYFED